jgi:hypothetical protein
MSGTGYWRSLVAVGIVVLALSVAPMAAADPVVLPPDEKHFGKTYGEWSATWWQWALSIPVHSPPFSNRINHPLVDLTGAECGEGQSGPVWFLGGVFSQAGAPAVNTFVRNDCTVPASKALFFPLVNIACSTLEGEEFGCATTEQGLREVVDSVIDMATNLSAEVDGVTIPITQAYRVGSANPAFCFTLPPDDILTFIGEGPFSPGRYCPAVDDGYYVMLAPLAKGKHTIHFHGEIPDFGFSLDVTYNLTVK